MNLPSTFDNQSTVYIRFSYTQSQDWSWNIDDIKVVGEPITPITSSFTWSPSGSITAGATTLTPTVAPSTTTTYFLNVTKGSCLSKDSVKITVDQKPVLPISITFDYNGPNNCYGRTIKLTENGGTLYGVAKYFWGTTSGASNINSGTTSSDITTTPTATTNYYVGITANGACATQNGPSATYTLPAKGTNLSGNNESATCYIGGTSKIDFYNPNSPYNYIGSINPNGRTGTVTLTSYLTGSSTNTQYACGMPGNEYFRTAYMERSFLVEPSGSISGAGNMTIYLPFKQSEFTDLSNASLTVTTGNVNDNISAPANLVATKFDASAGNVSFENNSVADNCGKGVAVTVSQSSSGTLTSLSGLSAITGTNDYASFSVSDFSEFWLHGINNNSPLPIKLTAFSANCNSKEGIDIKWITATESNVDYYSILRSKDGNNWSLVATVNAVGNSSETTNYEINDRNGTGIMYYRLASVDNDGTTQNYPPISVECSIKNDAWSVFPNPSSLQSTVSINATNSFDADLLVVDLKGKIVRSQPIHVESGVTNISLYINELSNGIYFIKLENSTDDFKPLRFIKSN